MAKKKVIIIGAGFGGLNAAKKLNDKNIDLLVLDRNNHHLFQPLLYQVATAALSPGNIASPIREVLFHQKNTSVLMTNVEKIDKENKQVIASNEDTYSFDSLIVATGARHCYFGHDEWENYAPGLKSVTDALRIRERMLLSFELAERCENPEVAEKYLRFIIVGGGPTGVELAGAVAEIAHTTLLNNFRHIKPEHAKIFLIEGQPEVLKTFHPKLGHFAHKYLTKMGVKIIPGTHVSNVVENGVWIKDEFFESFCIIWAAGNRASPLLETLNTPLDRAGRAIVEKDLSIPGYPDVFVIGDSAQAKDEKGTPYPGLATVAMQQGRYVAKLICKNISKEKRKPFEYFDKGTMATVGKSKAVASIRGIRLHGFFAWILWSIIHLFYIASHKNRFLVATQWINYYLTGSRQVRLIKEPIFGSDDAIFHTKEEAEHVGKEFFEMEEAKQQAEERIKEAEERAKDN